MTIKIPDLILPIVLPYPLGTEWELIADLLEHSSDLDALGRGSGGVPVDYLQEKCVTIMAAEVVGAGVPGNLLWWVELSPYPSTVTTAYWAAIGGGGGTQPPTVPNVIVAAGVHGTVHTDFIAWEVHSAYMRVVVQTPVAAALPNAFWAVQVLVFAKSIGSA